MNKRVLVSYEASNYIIAPQRVVDLNQSGNIHRDTMGVPHSTNEGGMAMPSDRSLSVASWTTRILLRGRRLLFGPPAKLWVVSAVLLLMAVHSWGQSELAPGSKGDPNAIATVRIALQSLGGPTVWSKIRSAETHLSVTRGASAQQMLLLDDWSTSDTMYRRGHRGQRGTPQDHNGRKFFNSRSDGKGRNVQEFDQARVLADHIPGAALEVILRRPEYLNRASPGYLCPDGSTCVDVYMRDSQKGAYIREERWEFSSTSHLPTKVHLLLPDLLHKQNTWKTVTFGDYRTYNGLPMPSSITIKLPFLPSFTAALVGITPNVPYDTKRFDLELNQ